MTATEQEALPLYNFILLYPKEMQWQNFRPPRILEDHLYFAGQCFYGTHTHLLHCWPMFPCFRIDHSELHSKEECPAFSQLYHRCVSYAKKTLKALILNIYHHDIVSLHCITMTLLVYTAIAWEVQRPVLLLLVEVSSDSDITRTRTHTHTHITVTATINPSAL